MRKIIGIGETILDIIFRNNQPSHAVPGGFHVQYAHFAGKIRRTGYIHQRNRERHGR